MTIADRSPARLHAGDVLDGYFALRRGAGHHSLDGCGRIQVSGRDALALVQQVVTRDVQYLLPETCALALVLNPNGRIADVVTVFAGSDGEVEVQTGAAAGRDTAALLRHQAQASGLTAEVDETGPSVSGLAVEGPTTWSVLGTLGLEEVIDLPFQGVRTVTWRRRPVRVARTGGTGEFGVELVGGCDVIAELGGMLGQLSTPVGPDALATAMLEVRHPDLSLCRGAGVIRAGVQWLVDVDKDFYIGREAMLGEAVVRERLLFTTMAETAVPAGEALFTLEEEVGSVVWSTFSPAASAVIGLAELDRDLCAPGVCVGWRDRGELRPVVARSSPIVVPGSWAVAAAERLGPKDDGALARGGPER